METHVPRQEMAYWWHGRNLGVDTERDRRPRRRRNRAETQAGQNRDAIMEINCSYQR